MSLTTVFGMGTGGPVSYTHLDVYKRQAGIESCLIGNMGVPVFEDIEAAETMTAVVEMSSHQLEFT